MDKSCVGEIGLLTAGLVLEDGAGLHCLSETSDKAQVQVVVALLYVLGEDEAIE